MPCLDSSSKQGKYLIGNNQMQNLDYALVFPFGLASVHFDQSHFNGLQSSGLQLAGVQLAGLQLVFFTTVDFPTELD
jgi:hypothetical protein